MDCNCPSIDCIQEIIEDVVYCNCPTVIEDIVCPEGCEVIIKENGNAVCSCVDTVEPVIEPTKLPIDFSDTDYFDEVSWTIAYSPVKGSWVSYYSFVPDYYVNHNSFFQTGNNYGIDKEKMWNHYLGNSSFQILNGRLEPFIIEYPIVNENVNKLLESVSLEVESRRWNNSWDYSVSKEIGFNKATVYNSTNNSGVLNLYPKKTMRDERLYPVTNGDNTQDILYTSLEGKHIFNYIFNRVKNQENHVPIWLWDESMVDKTINDKAVSFIGKRVLERLKGSHFFVRLTNDKNSQFQISLNKAINTEIVD